MLSRFRVIARAASGVSKLKNIKAERCFSSTKALDTLPHQEDLPALEDCRQGVKGGSLFSKAEMESRLRKLRALMAENNVDACVFTSFQNVCYYSEFLYCQFGRPYGLVVTQDEQTSISAKIDFGQPWRRTFGDNITYTDWQKDNYYRAVKKLVGENKRIGLEFDHVNIDSMEKFKSFIPGASFVDVGFPTMKQRLIKSAEEIDVIRNSAAIGDIGGAAVVEALHENVPEHEVSTAATHAMIRAIAAKYPQADIMDTWTWFQSGINTDGAHNPVTTRRVAKGDILSLNCFPMINGYYTALERTAFLDHATDREIELWEVNCKVHRRGIELIKPGAKCSDIAKELNEIFKEHNLLKYRAFGYGHSFGVLSHYYGREAGLELREDVDTILEPNMVVSMEPMITIPEGMSGAGGYREHDILVVKEDGNENVTKFPFGPEHNIVKK